MGSNPLSHMVNHIGYSSAKVGEYSKKASRLYTSLGQLADEANNASYGASSAIDELTHKYERAADVLIKGRDEAQREKERLYISQVDQRPITSAQIHPVAVPGTYTSVHTTTQFPYGQATPPASPHLHPTTPPYGQVPQFPYGQATPPASPQLHATVASQGQIPQFSDLGAAQQAQVAQALSQQPGLSPAEQAQLMEAYLAQNAQKPHAPSANEQINPQQRVSSDHELEARPSESLVNQFLTRDLELVPFKTFKEDHPQTRQRIEALASELPTPVEITSKLGLDNPLGKTRRLGKLQQINDHRLHLLKLINSSKFALGDQDEVTRYHHELVGIVGSLQQFATECNQHATANNKTFFTKPDNRKLASYATQLAQTAEQLRAILHNHAIRMPTKRDQAHNFTEYLVELNRQVKNDFADAYPEAKTEATRNGLIRKLRQYNNEIRGYLKTELPTPGPAGSEYDADTVLDFQDRIQGISNKEIDMLIEYKKPNLQMGDALKVFGIGSLLTGAGYSLLKMSPLKTLADPFAKFAFGGTVAGSLFSALPAKLKNPIMEGDLARGVKQFMERSYVTPKAPGRRWSNSQHVKYFFQSQL